MTIAEILSKELDIESEQIFWEDEDTLEEAKKVSGLEYKRHWHEFPKNEKHYSKKTGNRLYGCWIYDHREAMGCKYGDGVIVHHKDNDKHNNSKSNLQRTDRKNHCIIDPNARKYTDCKIPGCKNPHYSQHLCQKHYMQKFRAGKFGDYDKSKNYSKDER